MQFLGIYWFQARVQATCLDRSDQRQDHHPHQYHAPRNATPPSPDAGSVRDATHVLDVLTYIFLIYLQRPSRAGCRNQHLKFACFGPEPIYIVYIYIIPMCIYIYGTPPTRPILFDNLLLFAVFCCFFSMFKCVLLFWRLFYIFKKLCRVVKTLPLIKLFSFNRMIFTQPR